MMQLEELARQATTDAKLAVIDLEAPPIGPAKGKQPAQKSSNGWAKPILAFAALFLIAGTAWTVFGGNADVEDTRIANVDDLEADDVLQLQDIPRLSHPDAFMESIRPFTGDRTDDTEVLAGHLYGDDQGTKGYAVIKLLLPEGSDATWIENPGLEVRGLPTGMWSGSWTEIAWLESETVMGYAFSHTMDTDAVLAELQNPGVVDGEVPGDSEYQPLGSSILASGEKPDTVGYSGLFSIGLSSAEISEPYLFEVFAGSFEAEAAYHWLVLGDELVRSTVRDGKRAFVALDQNTRVTNSPVLVWEESPGVVAVLTTSVNAPSSVLETIAEELVATEWSADSDETNPVADGSAEPTFATELALVPSDGEIVARTPLPIDDPNVIAQSVVTHVYGESLDEIAMTVTTADWINADEFHQSQLSPTDVAIVGNPVFIGTYGDKAVASYQDRDYGQAVAIASDMTPEELLELIVAHPDINRGEVPDGMESLGLSQRFAAEDGLTRQLDIFGVNVEVDAGGGDFYNVTTFSGDAALELATHQFVEASTDQSTSERLIRGGKPSLLTVDVWDSRMTLIWAESDDVVVVLESGLDVSSDELYVWAEALVEQGSLSNEAGDRVDPSEADQSFSAPRIDEIYAEGNSIFHVQSYDNGGADIFYQADDGTEICVEVIGLDLEPVCVPAAGDELAVGYFIRTLGDDVDGGERSVIIIRRSGAPVTFPSHDPVVVTELSDGTEIILASTINPEDALVEVFDVNGSIIQNDPVQEP